MEVDIRNIPVYWITIESATDRHERMKTIFDKFGFTNTIQINGKLADKKGKSFMEIQQDKSHLVAETHAKALVNDGPLLVLEDDVWFTDDFDPIVDVPDDTEAVYLGTSVWGMRNGVEHNSFLLMKPLLNHMVCLVSIRFFT